jgi:hypothetical protein
MRDRMLHLIEQHGASLQKMTRALDFASGLLLIGLSAAELGR